MKKYSIIGTVTTLLLIVSFLMSQNSASANPSTITTSYLGGTVATGTMQYLTTAQAATSTIIIPISKADQADMNLLFVSSSTASTLNFTVDFSDDYACDTASTSVATGQTYYPITYTSACNWFRETTNSVSGNYILEASTTIHQWNPAVTATSSKNVSESNLAANYMRVQFFVTGANGGVWAQVAAKSQRP